MQTRKTLALTTAAALLAAGGLAGAAGPASSRPADMAGKPQKRTVKIGDNFFSPNKLTVNWGSTVTWQWPDDYGDTHDVALKKGPRGVKKFQSDPAAAAITYKRTFRTSGVYKIYCTFHETEMDMQITVRKKPTRR